MDSMELANHAVKELSGKYDDLSIRKAVLYACSKSPDLVPNNVIDEAVARVRRGVHYMKLAQNANRE